MLSDEHVFDRRGIQLRFHPKIPHRTKQGGAKCKRVGEETPQKSYLSS